ncbi:putative F-box protein [Sesamum angolense]|uniref:F-box protein n=1 Tax=Sesamum angolense TaxID=2727404 RepID=A0AAE1WZT5_9LAMI|nr:putative F-box protein [Sesamum angolense]
MPNLRGVSCSDIIVRSNVSVLFVLPSELLSRLMEPSSSNSQDLGPKKKVRRKNGDTDIDRLSELPEPLIIRILSFLEMKDAVKTDPLTKSWRNLWTHVDSIVFRNTAPRNEGTERFIAFVDKTWMQCTCPNIKKFVLHFSHDPGAENAEFLTEMFFNWVHCAFKKNVEYLELRILGLKSQPPEWFYQSSSLVRLKLYHVTLGFLFVRPIAWSSLRSLHLKKVKISNEQMAQLISGCPQLETMILDRLKHIITSPQHYLEKCENVETVLGLDNDDDLVDVQRLNVGTELLKSVCNVNEIVIGPVLIHALSILKLLDRPSPVFKCKRASLYMPISKYDVPGMACLLQNSPLLETLLIKVVTGRKRKINYNFCGNFKKIPYTNEDKYLDQQCGNFQRLRNVKFVYCKSFCAQNDLESNDEFIDDQFHDDGKCFDFELIAYILRGAQNLEKLIITSQKDYQCECGTNCVSRHASLLALLPSVLFLNRGGEWKWRGPDFELTYF